MQRRKPSGENGTSGSWHPLSIAGAAGVLLVTLSLTAVPWKLLLILVVIFPGLRVCGGSPGQALRSIRVLLWMLPFTFLMHIGLSPDGWQFFSGLFAGQPEWVLLSRAVRFTLQIFGFLLLMGGVIQLVRAQDFIDSLVRMLAPLRRLRVPIDPLYQMLNLGIRFLPVMTSETRRLREVRRGLGVPEHDGIRRRARSYVASLTSLFLGALNRAEAIGRMMHLRGYRPGVMRTSYIRHRWELRDTILLGVTLAIFGGVSWL